MLYTPPAQAPIALGINPGFQTYVRYNPDGTVSNHGTRTTLERVARTDRPPAWSDHGYVTAYYHQVWRQTLDVADPVRWKYGYREDFVAFTPVWERGTTTLAAGGELYNRAETTEDMGQTTAHITTNSRSGLALRLGVDTRVPSWLRLQAGINQIAELQVKTETTSPPTNRTRTTTLQTRSYRYGGVGADVAGWAIDPMLSSASSATNQTTLQSNARHGTRTSSASLTLAARRSF
ncbi:MAG: hypothetical protein AB1609_13430 [Bacillota bacterium]